jgi:hypothetical protein
MLSLNCKNVQHVKIYKKVPQLKMSDNCVIVIPLEMHFFLLTFTAFGYSNNQRETTKLSKIVGPIGLSDKILTRSDLNYFSSDLVSGAILSVTWNRQNA